MLQSWYNSDIVRVLFVRKKRFLFPFRQPFIIFADSWLTGQEMLPDFASRMLKNAYNKNVIPINMFVIIIDLQRFICNFAIWILKR